MGTPAHAITVDQLAVLVEVVDQGSFTAAAKAHRRTQGSVSYHIARLEEQLGLALFERRGRRPVLTEPGEAIVRHARTVLGALDRLVATAEELGAGVEAEVRICVDVLFPPASAAAMLRAFEARFPHVPLTMTTGVWRAPVAALVEGRVHVAVAPPMAAGGLPLRPTARVELVPVVAADHPLTTAPAPVSITTLRAHRRLLLASHDALPREDGSHETEVWRLDDAAARYGLLLEGLGWARLARWQVAQDLAAGRLVALDVDGSIGASHVELAVMVDPSRAIGPATRWLVDHLAEPA